MFGLSVAELTIIALMCLPIALLFGVMLKKMGYSDLAAIGLSLLMLTPAIWLVLAYLVFFKWPIQEELELLQRQVDDRGPSLGFRPTTPESPSNVLHVAIRKGYADVVEALVSEGIDTNAKTAVGQTPLQLAIDCGNEEIAEILRRH